MKSRRHGDTTSEVEVTQIDTHGIWVLVGDKEFSLPFSQFPNFKNAAVGEIQNVELANGNLRWPKLGLSVPIKSLGEPEHVPLLTESK